MNFPLLTITIPTYNRHDNLKELYKNFLKPIIDAEPEMVRIVVCDNSDGEQAGLNEALLLHNNIKYIKNERNIGYAGNVISCIKNAEGSYVWILPDDDDVDLENFFSLLEILPSIAENDYDCIFLPLLSSDGLGNEHLINTKDYWAAENGQKLDDLLIQNDQFPFVLPASVILSLKRADQDLIEAVHRDYEDNDFIQIPLFLEVLSSSASLYFYSDAIISYNATGNIRFTLPNLASSMNKIIGSYWQHNDRMQRQYYKRSFRTWIGWFLMSRSSLYVVPDAAMHRSDLILLFFAKGYSFVNAVLLVLSFFPPVILRWLYQKLRGSYNKAIKG